MQYLEKLLEFLLDKGGIEKLSNLFRIVTNFVENYLGRYPYKVETLESNLMLMDPRGEKAVIQKNEKVIFLQNNIYAILDQAWGDGEILQDYKVSPGEKVDQYRIGHKTYLLISLQEVRNRGEKESFSIKWKMKNGFLKPTGFWATDINHPTKKLVVNIFFPKGRPPKRVWLVEREKNRSEKLGKENIHQLVTGRWQVSWQIQNPRSNESYILKWIW